MLLKCNTLLRLNWMPAFLKQPWSTKRITLCVVWKNNLETFEKLFSMIQSRCSIYCHFLEPLHWNIHKLWHQALLLKIAVEDFKKIVKSPHFLHLTSINWLAPKIRSCLTRDVEYSVYQNSLDDNLCKSDMQVDIYLKLLLI